MHLRLILLVALLLPVALAAPGISSPALAAPAGTIAYAGNDGNIWTMQADGSGKQRLTDAAPGQTFGHPRWSPDGTMLVFDATRKEGYRDVADGIYLYRNGGITRLPGLDPCAVPAFMPDGQRLALSCGRRDDAPPKQYSPQQLQTDPALASVSTSKLDGSDWRVLVPYYIEGQTPYSPCCNFGVYRIEFSPADGAMLLNIVTGSDGAVAVVLGDADGHLRPPLRLYDETYPRRSEAAFAPGGKDLLLTRCSGCVIGDQTPYSVALVQMDRDGGNERVVLPDVATGFTSPGPDGQTLVYSVFTKYPNGTLYLASIPNGTPQAIGDGHDPAWQPAPTAPTQQCFAETGRCIQGHFLAQWQQHGGLAINGFPISDEFTETLEDGQPYTVQYFERVRLEYHPGNAPPYDVLLGQFGRRLHPADPPVDPQPGATYVPETGHNVPADFAAFWTANGGLAQFGYPLSEVIAETLEDGTMHEVQYFERARFERHPESADPQYQVLLGQFGRRIYGQH